MQCACRLGMEVGAFMGWLIGFSVFLAVAIGAAGIAIGRRLRRTQPEAPAPATLGSTPASPIVRVPASVLFDRPDEFAVALGEASLENLNRTLATNLGVGDSTSLVVQGVRYVRSSDAIQWTLSPAAQEGIRQGRVVFEVHKETGKLLPTVKQGGRFAEQIKGVPLSRMGRLARAAPAAALATAHIISGADLNKRLRAVEGKLDLLVAFRRIDQQADLERIYSHAKELLLEPLTESSVTELRTLCSELQGLRSKFRQELSLRLKNVEDPSNDGFWRRLLTRKKTKDKKLHDEIAPGVAELRLLEISFFLELAIRDAIGTTRYFTTSRLPEELDLLEGVRLQLQEKSNYLTGKFAEEGLTTRPMEEGFLALLDGLAAFADDERLGGTIRARIRDRERLLLSSGRE